MNLQRSFYKIVRTVSKNLPSILTGASAMGVFATGYFAAKAAHDTAKTLSSDASEFEKEEWKEVAINYIPAIAAATVTIGTMVMANTISMSRIKGLKIAYGEFGNRTRNMLMAYQAENGLEADGVCGNDTWKALLNRE